METFFLKKRGKTTHQIKDNIFKNGIGQTGCLKVEECKMINICHTEKKLMHQRPQHRDRFFESDKREPGNKLETEIN